MAEVSDERVSFGKLTRSHAQYGTTSSATNSRIDNAMTFITHAVQTGDTLQGIAVKYGVAVSVGVLTTGVLGAQTLLGTHAGCMGHVLSVDSLMISASD